jgi:hypothetical protein
MNRDWHEAHVMPKNATTEERIAWHREHTQNCGCRPFPKGLLAKLDPARASALQDIGQGRPK